MVIQDSESTHTFRVYLPEATSVELVGTFTAWRACAIRMTRESTGWWSASTQVPPGEHDFSYLVNGASWVADYAASGVRRNAFGGWVSQLYVSEPAGLAPNIIIRGPAAAAVPLAA